MTKHTSPYKVVRDEDYKVNHADRSKKPTVRDILNSKSPIINSESQNSRFDLKELNIDSNINLKNYSHDFDLFTEYDISKERKNMYQNFRKRTSGEIKKRSFSVKIEGIGNTFIELDTLEDTEKQELCYQIEDFLDARDQCDWSEENSLKALKLLLGKSFTHYARNACSIDEIFNILIKLTYNKRKFEENLHTFRNIKMYYKEDIEDYIKRIYELKYKTELCSENNAKLNDWEIFDYFIFGLPVRLREFIIDKNITNIDEALNEIISRKIIHSRYKYRKDLVYNNNYINSKFNLYTKLNHSYNRYNDYNKNKVFENNNYKKYNNFNRDTDIKEQIDTRNKNYNKDNNYNKRTYDRLENFVYSNNRNKNQIKNNFINTRNIKKYENKRTYLLHDKPKNAENIKLEGEINKNKVNFIMDTGSNTNVISKKLVDKLNIESKYSSCYTNITLGNGKEIKIIGKGVCYINIYKIPSVNYKIELSIIESEIDEIILGVNFMEKENVIINFKDYLIEVDNKTIYFGEEKINAISDPDKELIGKVNFFYTKIDKVNNKISSMIKNSEKFANKWV